MLVHGFLFVHFPRDFSLFAEFSGRILFKKKKKRSQFRIVYGSVGKLDLGRCRMSPLCRRKNSSGRETSSIFYLKKREAVNRRDISIFFFFFFWKFFANHFLFCIFILYFSLSPGCSSSIAISTLIDRGTLIPNIPESGALDINLFSSLSYSRNSSFHSSLFPLVRTLYGPSSSSLSLVPCIPFV